jgi:type IV pilus assembly protein PilO
VNNLFRENARIFSLLIVLLFVLLIVVYFVYVSPQSKQLKAAKQNVSNLESEIAALEANRDRSTDDLDSDALLLKRKVPLNPELENLLLTFQEIELVSGSRIENIVFRYDGELPENDSSSEESQENQSTDADENTNDANATAENNDSEPANTINGNNPEFLKLITAAMDVLSPDYDSFQEFLQELEKRERIMRVDKLTFKKPAERELLDGSDETITFTIEVTTFYYEE